MESKYKGTGLAFRSPVLPYVAAKIQASTMRAMRHVSRESDRYVLVLSTTLPYQSGWHA